MIDGIPRTLDDLERMAAAEKAYDQDFPAPTLESAEVEVEDDDVEAGEMDVMAHEANRHAMMRDYAFTVARIPRLVVVLQAQNRRSVAVAERIGGVEPRRAIYRDREVTCYTVRPATPADRA